VKEKKIILALNTIVELYQIKWREGVWTWKHRDISFLQYDFLKCVAGDLQNDEIGLGGFWVRKYYFIDTDGLI